MSQLVSSADVPLSGDHTLWTDFVDLYSLNRVYIARTEPEEVVNIIVLNLSNSSLDSR